MTGIKVRLPEIAVVELNGDGGFRLIDWACGCVTEQQTAPGGLRIWTHTKRCSAHTSSESIPFKLAPTARDDVRRDFKP